MVRDSVTVAVCWGLVASFTVTTTLLVPAVEGIPAIAPVLKFIVRPAGKPVAVHW